MPHAVRFLTQIERLLKFSILKRSNLQILLFGMFHVLGDVYLSLDFRVFEGIILFKFRFQKWFFRAFCRLWQRDKKRSFHFRSPVSSPPLHPTRFGFSYTKVFACENSSA